MPARGRTIPRIVFSVVDLPDALPPEQADELAVADLERDVAEDVDRAVERVHAGEAKEGRRSRRGRGRRAHVRAAPPVPRYASTTRGLVATASNVPSAILTPWSSATTRSEIPSTTCMSCSITRMV